MKPSTLLQLLIIANAVAVLIALGVLWSWWASALMLGSALVNGLLTRGVKSLEAGGE